MRHRCAALGHQLKVAPGRVVHARILGDEIAVPDQHVGCAEPDRVQQLDRCHTVLGHDLEELDHVVRRVDRNRHAERVRRLAGLAQQLQRHQFGGERDQNPADTPVGRARVLADEVDRRPQPASPLLLVPVAHQTAVFPAHPVGGGVGRRQIGADAETLRFGEQRLLHRQLCAEIHEGRRAVAQQLGDRIGRRIDAAPGGRFVLVRPLDPVAGIAAVGAAAAGRQGLEEGLAEILGPPGIGDQPMGGAVAGMDVRVDEAGRNQLGSRVDLAVEVAVVVRADMDDRLVLVDHHPVTDQRMCGTGIPNHPTAANERPHESLPWPWRSRTRQRRDRLAQLPPLSPAHIAPSTSRSNHDMYRDGNHPTVWPPPLHQRPVTISAVRCRDRAGIRGSHGRDSVFRGSLFRARTRHRHGRRRRSRWQATCR